MVLFTLCTHCDAYVVGTETMSVGALAQVRALVGDGEVLASFAKRYGACVTLVACYRVSLHDCNCCFGTSSPLLSRPPFVVFWRGRGTAG
jgi:hypothetical protein